MGVGMDAEAAVVKVFLIIVTGTNSPSPSNSESKSSPTINAGLLVVVLLVPPRNWASRSFTSIATALFIVGGDVMTGVGVRL